MPTHLVKRAGEFILLLAVAVALWILGLPFIAALVLVFGIRFLFGTTRAAFTKIAQWLAYAIIAIFLTLLLGKVVGVYPIDFLNAFLAQGRGFWIFWGRNVSLVFLFGLGVIALVLAYIYKVPRLGKLAIGIAVLVLGLQIRLPQWQDRIADTYHTVSTVTASMVGVSPSGAYPFCADAQDYPFAGSTDFDLRIEVPMQLECRSGLITTPLAWSNVAYSSSANKGFEICFLNGSCEWLEPNKEHPWPATRAIFRVRGEGVLTLWYPNVK